ncbi:XrtA/PEP-CTERM system TPR-repeat protein PrsT [Elioraea rosea]|uniref:XrtA/PEP-CTERM system TPR-repeat protein PrsT n=1 Tax=Elioraea rosea TaxID=2492390 RepID=UPI0011857779|nr:XrtA/PEP-CTERM system TPR-repeat protein PrsT [Elioraea rosea]
MFTRETTTATGARLRARRPFRLALLSAAAAALLAAMPAEASVERARAAQARGDLRAAQIEYRNAVRTDPNSAALRAALAQASLDIGDTDTAEKEARAALERGYDPVAGTALLMRSYLARGRFDDLLRDFPPPAANAPPAVAAQVLSGRALAQIGTNQKDEAARSVAEAVRLAPDTAAVQVVAAQVALADGKRDVAEAALDRALAIEPNNVEALLRKGTVQYERGDLQGAADTFAKLIGVMPGNTIARTRRADALLRLGRDADALAEVEAALRTAPGYAVAVYQRAMLHARAQEWRQADEILQRLGTAVTNFSDGLLLLAATKQALGQRDLAEDAARRYVARRPEDPRGVKLLAALEMAAGRPDAAAGTLERLAMRGGADAEAYEMLGRAHLAARRPRESAEAYEKAAELARDNVQLQARLAAARLASGDAAGAAEAAETVLRLDPSQTGMHQILAGAALARGDLAAASAALEKVPPAARDTELVGIIDGTIDLVRVNLPGARTAFESVLKNHPNSVRARLGLARVAAMQGNGEEVDKLLAEVLEREPGNAEAALRLSAAAQSSTPRAAAARASLERAQAAAPDNIPLAIATARMQLALREPAKAVAILDATELRQRRRGVEALTLLAEAHAAQEQWQEAEAAARAALAEDPNSITARQQVAALLLRGGNARGAEGLLEIGLNAQPASMPLQQSLVQVVRQDRGLDAALETADRLARNPRTRPASLALRGDLLRGADRNEEAAQAYAAGYAQAPSQLLALRLASTHQALGKPDQAAAALSTWLAREPGDAAVASQLAQIELVSGRTAEAERRLAEIVKASPEDWLSLNNLAWLMQARSDPATAEGKATLAQARLLAERAYYISPTPETSDTLGWILAREGQVEAGLPLIRQAAAATVARQRADPSMLYRLGFALKEAGQRDEAIRVLDAVVKADVQFPEREAATRLLETLRAGG